MAKGVYKRTPEVLQYLRERMSKIRSSKFGFKKGHKINVGKKFALGKHWKIKDTSKYKGNTHGFQKGHKIRLGKKWPEGHHPLNKGKKMPERSGENHSRWIKDRTIITENHRIRCSIEFRLWRESVFARDNWTCQKYEIKGGKLHPHHIQNFAQYPELRFAIDNGITLSEKAHREFHKIYGVRNNTKEQLDEFLIN